MTYTVYINVKVVHNFHHFIQIGEPINAIKMISLLIYGLDRLHY